MADLFIRDEERVYGPYSPVRIKQLAAAGRITPSWWIGKAKEGPWTLAGKVNGLFSTPDANGTAALEAPSPTLRSAAANPLPAASVPNTGLDSITTWLCRFATAAAVLISLILAKTLLVWLLVGLGSPLLPYPVPQALLAILDGISSLVGLLYGITFLIWIYKATQRLREQAGTAMRFSPGWAVGWLFIPVANFYKPYQVMKAVWQVSHAKAPADPVLVRRWWGLTIASVVLAGLLVLFTGICLVSPTVFSINAQFAVVTVMALVGLADKLVTIALATRIRDAYRNGPQALAGPLQPLRGNTNGSPGATKMLWGLIVAAVLVPCVFLIGWRTNQPVAVRRDAALPTGWYLEDLPDAVEQSKREGKDLLVLFTADWCGPCRRLKRDLAGAEAFRRGVLICVVDCDKQKALSHLHQVQGIPDLRLYRNGAEVKRKTGYGGSLADLETWKKDG
jgi:thiol-disulfide isomerase/thioredoxin